jgi:hypothetical protein
MKTLLQNKHSRRNFLIMVGAILLCILLIRFLWLPIYEPVPDAAGIIPKDPSWLTIVSRLLDSIFISLTVTVAIGWFLFKIELPDEEKKFEIVEPFKIGELFQRERSGTDEWFFSGGTGRFTRSKTIPELSKIAKNNNQHINIKIQVIDPTDEQVCSNYAKYRKGLRSAENKDLGHWTKEYVRQEILTTIVSAIIHKSHYPLLDIAIGLKNNFSTMRIDMSSKVAIITKEDKQEPALVCREGSFLYRTYKEEILQTFKEYKQVNTLPEFEFSLKDLTVDNVREVIEKLCLSDGLSNDDYVKVHTFLKENKNPYGK